MAIQEIIGATKSGLELRSHWTKNGSSDQASEIEMLRRENQYLLEKLNEAREKELLNARHVEPVTNTAAMETLQTLSECLTAETEAVALDQLSCPTVCTNTKQLLKKIRTQSIQVAQVFEREGKRLGALREAALIRVAEIDREVRELANKKEAINKTLAQVEGFIPEMAALPIERVGRSLNSVPPPSSQSAPWFPTASTTQSDKSLSESESELAMSEKLWNT
eukprot:Colp12_sorted_trinity150504_noHs@22781